MSQSNFHQVAWTDAQKATVRRLYPTASQQDIKAALPEFGWRAIQSQASRLGLRRARQLATDWSAEELALLRKHYGPLGGPATAALIGRTHSAVRAQAVRAGFSTEAKPVFNEAENAAIQALYPTQPRAVILAALPGRTWARIQARAWYMGLKRTVHFRPRRPPAAKLPPRYPSKAAPAKLTKPVVPPAVLTAAPAPKERKPSTPVADAAQAARRRKQQAEQVKPVGFVTAAEVRALPPAHPARLAFTRAAYHGPEAAAKAFHEAMKQAA